MHSLMAAVRRLVGHKRTGLAGRPFHSEVWTGIVTEHSGDGTYNPDIEDFLTEAPEGFPTPAAVFMLEDMRPVRVFLKDRKTGKVASYRLVRE